jgi:hypothetical protein
MLLAIMERSLALLAISLPHFRVAHLGGGLLTEIRWELRPAVSPRSF